MSSSTKQYAEACKFEHSNSGGRYGENLYAGTGDRSFDDAMESWMSEASAYDYNHPGFSSATGHFTQVVWKGSTQLTVGIGSCPAGTISLSPAPSWWLASRRRETSRVGSRRTSDGRRTEPFLVSRRDEQGVVARVLVIGVRACHARFRTR
ncbi:CAP domain-containing protein [Nocardia sp. CA-128927]|uniref:CAP domain-containing protein n=1 Tax=Nocardia sp. CA-128927 TaxID=3239975 RepID=UPI003D9709D8